MIARLREAMRVVLDGLSLAGGAMCEVLVAAAIAVLILAIVSGLLS